MQKRPVRMPCQDASPPSLTFVSTVMHFVGIHPTQISRQLIHICRSVWQNMPSLFVPLWWYSVFGLDLLNCMTCQQHEMFFKNTVLPKYGWANYYNSYTQMYILGGLPLTITTLLGWPTGGLVTIICPRFLSKEGEFQVPSECFSAWKICSSFGGPDLTIHTRWAPTSYKWGDFTPVNDLINR